jgi:MFS family permease
MTTGLLWLTQLTPTSTYLPGLLGPLLLLGIGGGSAFSPLNIVIMATVRPQEAGAAGGVLQTMQNLGATLGLAVLVTVFGTGSRQASAHGATQHTALVSGMTDAFRVAIVFAAASILVALTFRRRTTQATPSSEPAPNPGVARN